MGRQDFNKARMPCKLYFGNLLLSFLTFVIYLLPVDGNNGGWSCLFWILRRRKQIVCGFLLEKKKWLVIVLLLCCCLKNLLKQIWLIVFFTKKMTAQSQTQMVFSSQLRFCDFVFEKWLIGLYMDPFLTRFSILKMCTFLSGASFAGFFPIKWLSFWMISYPSAITKLPRKPYLGLAIWIVAF